MQNRKNQRTRAYSRAFVSGRGKMEATVMTSHTPVGKCTETLASVREKHKRRRQDKRKSRRRRTTRRTRRTTETEMLGELGRRWREARCVEGPLSQDEKS